MVLSSWGSQSDEERDRIQALPGALSYEVKNRAPGRAKDRVPNILWGSRDGLSAC